MNGKEKLILQREIAKIESQVATIQESLDSIKETLKYLKDIARDSDKKESK